MWPLQSETVFCLYLDDFLDGGLSSASVPAGQDHLRPPPGQVHCCGLTDAGVCSWRRRQNHGESCSLVMLVTLLVCESVYHLVQVEKSQQLLDGLQNKYSGELSISPVRLGNIILHYTEVSCLYSKINKSTTVQESDISAWKFSTPSYSHHHDFERLFLFIISLKASWEL